MKVVGGPGMGGPRGASGRALDPPWGGRAGAAAAVLTAGALVLAALGGAARARGEVRGGPAAADGHECAMTFMRPGFRAVGGPALEGGGAGYRLLEYREEGAFHPRGGAGVRRVPVLFVHGNGGSFRQVRSLASQTAKGFHAEALGARGRVGGETLLDWYAVDFREELSAYAAGVLEAQVDFVERSMAAIAEMDEGMGASSPGHLILVGHSMGGVVAKAALLRGRRRSAGVPEVPLLVTLASPLAAHPFLAEHALAAFYSGLQAAWAAEPRKPAVLSVSGGWRDTLVDDGLALESGEHAVSVSTEGVPGVMLSADHQAILWCNELVQKLEHTMAQLSNQGRLAEGGVELAAAVAGIFLEGAADKASSNAWTEDLAAGAPACEDAPTLPDVSGIPRTEEAIFKRAVPVAGGASQWHNFAWDLQGSAQLAVRLGGLEPCTGFHVSLWKGAHSVDVTRSFSRVTSSVWILLLAQVTLGSYDTVVVSVRGRDIVPPPSRAQGGGAHLVVQLSPEPAPLMSLSAKDILTAAAGGAATFEPRKHHMASKFSVRRGATWLPFGVSAKASGEECLPTVALVWDLRLDGHIAQANRSVYVLDSAVHSAALDPLYATDPAALALLLTDPTCEYRVILEPVAWVGILRALTLKGSAVPALALGLLFTAYRDVTDKVEQGDPGTSAVASVGAVASSMVPFFAFCAVKVALLGPSRGASAVLGFADVVLYLFAAGLAVILAAGAEAGRGGLLRFKPTRAASFTIWMHANRALTEMHGSVWALFSALVALFSATIHPAFAHGFSALVCFAASLRDYAPAQALLGSALFVLVGLVGAPSLMSWLHSCAACANLRLSWSTWPEFAAASLGVFYSLMTLRLRPGLSEFESRRMGALLYAGLYCGLIAALEVPYQLPFAVALAVAAPAAAAALFVGQAAVPGEKSE